MDLRAGETRGQVWIEVENLAAGLSGDDLAKLFEPFWRKDDTIVHGVGFGLGLAVSRSLAQSHGGELTAFQPSPGMLRMRLEVPSAPAVVTGA